MTQRRAFCACQSYFGERCAAQYLGLADSPELSSVSRLYAHYGGVENDPVIPQRTDQERILAARIAAHASLALTPDREVRTRPARAAFLAHFERQVNPDNLLSPQERHLRAESAKRAYFQSRRSSRRRPGVAEEHMRPGRGHRRRPETAFPLGVTFLVLPLSTAAIDEDDGHAWLPRPALQAGTRSVAAT